MIGMTADPMSQSRLLSAPPQHTPALSNYITLWRRSEQLFLAIPTLKHIPEVPTITYISFMTFFFRYSSVDHASEDSLPHVMNHFIILLKCKGVRIHMEDPVLGEVKYVFLISVNVVVVIRLRVMRM
jgi:hypothetical protein